MATVQETNCHPFRHGRWLFVHNGEIEDFAPFRRDLYMAVAPHLFNHIQGTTDSELMFYLALTFGLEDDPIGGVERMAGFVEQMARDNGVAQSLWMTLGFTDGNAIYAVRYASDGDAPTLFHTDDTEHLYRLNKMPARCVFRRRNAVDRLGADWQHGGKMDRNSAKHGRDVSMRAGPSRAPSTRTTPT